MSEYGELINQYIAKETIVSSLSAAGLTEAELDVASGAIQKERAQWVVNGIAAELGQRAIGLTAKKESLTDELRQVQDGLDIISSTFNFKSQLREGALTSDNLVGLYDKQLSYESERRIMQDQGPFNLRLASDARNIPSLNRWVERARLELESTYGSHIKRSMSRAATVVDRAVLDSASRLSDVQDAVVLEELHGEPTLRINDPEKVLSDLFDERNFGHKSLIGLLCLAHFQATNPDIKY
jgi:hypothetical protein